MSAPAPFLTAWLLHSRPFRDTSLLLDFFTLERGRVSAIARGARSSKSRLRSLLQPFMPLVIDTVGRHELQTLRGCEVRTPPLGQLLGERLFAGFYVNELLVRLLGTHEAEASLFRAYEETLQALAGAQDMEMLLRCFELELLENLGYGVQFDSDANSGEILEEQACYYLQTDGGFVRQQQAWLPEAGAQGLYPGNELRRIMLRDFSAASTRRCAKQLLRELLQRHLGDRPLSSRELFRRHRKVPD